MVNVHGEEAYTKRKVTKLVTEETREKRRIATKRLHQDGTFLNTHVKRETLLEFVQVYDQLLSDLFSSDEYDGNHYKQKWEIYFRITANELEERSLEDIFANIRRGGLTGYGTRRLLWAQRAFEDNFFEYI